MNWRVWAKVGLGLLVLAIFVLELTAMASARLGGFSTFFWPLAALALVSALVVCITALVQLVRSRFRFSLGSLLLAFVVLALALPTILETVDRIGRYRHIHRILAGAQFFDIVGPESLKEFLGDDRVLAFCEVKNLGAKSQSGDEWLALFDNSLGLEELHLNSGVTDQGVAGLSRITTLRTLSLPGSVLTETSLSELSTLPNLETLVVDKPATRSGFCDLARLPSLKSLAIGRPGSPVTDADLAELTGLRDRLTLLVLTPNSPVTDAGLQHIGELTALEGLGLDNTLVCGPGLAHLARLPRLKNLSLTNTPVDDAGLAYLKGCPELETLSLNSTLVTDAGLVHLEELPKLQMLYVTGTKITREGAARLHRAKPTLILYPDEDLPAGGTSGAAR